jgi:hypothetical protein
VVGDGDGVGVGVELGLGRAVGDALGLGVGVDFGVVLGVGFTVGLAAAKPVGPAVELSVGGAWVGITDALAAAAGESCSGAVGAVLGVGAGGRTTDPETGG